MEDFRAFVRGKIDATFDAMIAASAKPKLRTHPVGAPGSVARFLDDHAHNPDADPFPAPFCLFRYGRSGEPPVVLAASKPGRLDFEPRALAQALEAGCVLVDVRTYGCRVLPS